MSYVERICSGSFRISRRHKKRRILSSWSFSSGWGQELLGHNNEQKHSKEMIEGFFKINSSKRLKVFVDDGDGLFKRKKDDLLTSYKLSRRERRSFNMSDVGSFDVEYISWHLPPDLCTQSECFGDYYRIFINIVNSDTYISSLVDSQQGEFLREVCLG